MTYLSQTKSVAFTARPRRPLITMVKGLVAGVFLGGARCGGPGYDGDYDDRDPAAMDAGDADARDGSTRADARVDAPDAATDADAEVEIDDAGLDADAAPEDGG